MNVCTFFLKVICWKVLNNYLTCLQQAEAAAIIHTNGCVDAAIQTAKDNMFLIGGVGVGIVIPQVSSFLYPSRTCCRGVEDGADFS